MATTEVSLAASAASAARDQHRPGAGGVERASRSAEAVARVVPAGLRRTRDRPADDHREASPASTRSGGEPDEVTRAQSLERGSGRRRRSRPAWPGPSGPAPGRRSPVAPVSRRLDLARQLLAEGVAEGDLARVGVGPGVKDGHGRADPGPGRGQRLGGRLHRLASAPGSTTRATVVSARRPASRLRLLAAVNSSRAFEPLVGGVQSARRAALSSRRFLPRRSACCRCPP